MNSARQLTSLLKKVDSTNVEKIYIINDISSYFGSANLKDLTGIKKEIIKINSLSGYTFSNNEDNHKSGIKFSTENKSISVDFFIPSYCTFYFEGINLVLFDHKEAEVFERNEKINYLFPSEKVIGYTKLTNFKKYDFGNELKLFIKSDKPAFFIFFNLEKGEYESKIINM